MQQARFRMFAGPNGSGKTHLFKFLKAQSIINTEIYVNADEIEKKLALSFKFHFNAYRIKVSDSDFKKHILESGILNKIKDKSFLKKIEIISGILYLKIKKNELNSYIASFIASFLATKLIQTKQSFCLETVLSHESKIKLIQQANKNGYKTYLYFVFTENWKLNVERVRLRVLSGGHAVNSKKIGERFYRSLRLFSLAGQEAYNTFLIDNSTNFDLMCALIKNKPVFISEKYPEWLKEYYNPYK